MNSLTTRLGITFPLIQAGMGGIAGPELAAAVASAGAGGVLALYRMSRLQIRAVLRRTRGLTDRPFGVNLIPEVVGGSLVEQVDAVLSDSDRTVFFTFYGNPTERTFETILRANRALLIMVGSAKAMKDAQAFGASAVVLQGIEAGGHLLGEQRLPDLVTEALDSGCRVPFLVAGGIASGSDFRRYQSMGASGCVCGTLFAATHESQAHPLYKERLVKAGAEDTVLTDIFDGGWPNRRHRVLRNSLTQISPEKLPSQFIGETTVSGRRYPVQRYSATVPTQNTTGRIEDMAMYCGESVRGVHNITSARHRVETFVAEMLDWPPVRPSANSTSENLQGPA